MTLSATSPTPLPASRLLAGLLVGSALVAAGLAADYLAVATPFLSTLVPAASTTGSPIGIGLGVWAFALIAGAALLVAGTDRLARLVALLRRGSDGRGPAARALASAAEDLAVASRVSIGGSPIPELVFGPFGAAVVHQMPSSRLIRRGARWETRTSDGWVPMDDPLEAATRDADRVRRWLSMADLDFVVRVYAAVVVDDRTIQRSPLCATLTPEQIPGWVAALPRQRTLTKARRDRLLAMATAPVANGDDRQRRGW